MCGGWGGRNSAPQQPYSTWRVNKKFHFGGFSQNCRCTFDILTEGSYWNVWLKVINGIHQKKPKGIFKANIWPFKAILPYCKCHSWCGWADEGEGFQMFFWICQQRFVYFNSSCIVSFCSINVPSETEML